MILANDIKSPGGENFLRVGGHLAGVHPPLGLADVGQLEHHHRAGADHWLQTARVLGVQQVRILPVERKEDLANRDI